MARDSEPLVPAAPAAAELRLRPANFKLVASLFFLFLTVVSEAFTGGVIARFGPKARVGRSLTAWGTVLQGIFLVLGYLVLAYLTENDLL